MIVPLSETPPALLEDYLSRRGVPYGIIRWKYFDSPLNANGERGFVAMEGDRVHGLIGLIPFTLGRQGQAVAAAWSCDWSVHDYKASPFTGIMLLKRAINDSGPLLALGGNSISQKLFGRVADVKVSNASVRMDLPLRLGAARGRLERKIPAARWMHRSPHWEIPLWRRPRPGRGTQVRWEEGVSRAIAALLESDAGHDWRPRYSFEYVDWQVGLCPAVDAWTCYVTDGSVSRAAALCWRLREHDGVWRMALWSMDGECDSLVAVLDRAIEGVLRERGHVLSAVASRLDAASINALKSRGFRRFRAMLPLFVCVAKRPDVRVTELHGLDYLATDLAYRL